MEGFAFEGSGRLSRVDTFTTKAGKNIYTLIMEALKAAGLTQYIKQGAGFETTVWRKVESAAAARKR